MRDTIQAHEISITVTRKETKETYMVSFVTFNKLL